MKIYAAHIQFKDGSKMVINGVTDLSISESGVSFVQTPDVYERIMYIDMTDIRLITVIEMVEEDG